MEERTYPQISITVNPEVLKEIDRLSKKMGIKRSRLISNILLMGVGDVRILEKVGLIDVARIVRDFQRGSKKELGIA